VSFVPTGGAAPDHDGLPRSLRAALDILGHEIQKLYEDAGLVA